MKKILNLLFTVCAFSLLTFTSAYAQSEAPETAGVGQQEDDSVDCIAINGGSGQGSSDAGTSDDSAGAGGSTTR
jgi:hypothetical protein